ncbi:hypothetical protein S40288_00887 [Stachybotrys chartarum IBT 40288]|nr:hypothetical protein S40288_00887 [Stachybotrys chartarum IBT 40288]
MDSGWWITFWVLFAIFALVGARGMFRIPFCVFLILMRTSENQMSHQCWVAFWLCLSQVYADLYVPVDGTAAVFWALIVLIVRFFVVTSEYYMPTSVFWVLCFVLFPTCWTSTGGSLLSWAILLFNWHLKNDGIHLPGLLIPAWLILALGATVVIVANFFYIPGYIPSIFIWFSLVGLMHHNFWPWNTNFGLLWFAAWFFSLHTIMYAFAPDMPVLWYVLMVGTVAGLGYVIRPDESLGRLVLCCAAIFASRFFFFYVYGFYFVLKQRADLFPFNYFSSDWRTSKPPWHPLNLRAADSLNSTDLCQRCHDLTSESKLIMGSSTYLTKMTEWHNFWTRYEFGLQFFHSSSEDAEALDSSSTLPTSSCHLCCLIWYSMSTARQQTVISRLSEGTTANATVQLPEPDDAYAELRVKVWEERPLSRYTYMQLFWGDVAVGARLLVHREGGIASPSTAVLHTKTDSDAHFEQARKWLRLCSENHKFCHGVGNTKLDPPARIVYVAVGKNWKPGEPPLTLKLVRTSDMGANKEYLALSHCWGPTAEMRFKLLASNMDRCFEEIDFHGLSKNLQDAITTTASLGFSYIWIDSLCIMQRDDSGTEVGEISERWKLDWETEAKRMGGVYSGATCTIASTGSATSNEGFFHERNLQSLFPCKIGVSSLDSLAPEWIHVRRDDVFDFEKSVDLAPLNTRGWVMQERLLSRRILHFGTSMIYWECCGRSASELNPHGYTYKSFPEDFKDNYVPELGSRIRTRGQMQQAERDGNGLGWATTEGIRRRPPPVMLDPDAPSSTQVVWQQKRGFWKNILKPTAESWDTDDMNEKAFRAGFRAAFEQLRSELYSAQSASVKLVGRNSFSQTWYDIVETYSRGNLTVPTDKLIALKGIEDEVARATKFTYLKGLWEEQLVTDLLWFAIEGPGKRLTSSNGDPVAPTWSWASVQGAIALDLLPETALSDIEETKTLVTIEDARPSHDDPQQMSITLCGPLLPISAPIIDGTTWSLDIGKMGKSSARVFPDVTSSDMSQMSNLFCLSFIVLDREKKRRMVLASSEDVQGLVLRLVRRGEYAGAPDEYERVGYFTTSYITKSGAAKKGRKALKTADVTRLCLVGWSGPTSTSST